MRAFLFALTIVFSTSLAQAAELPSCGESASGSLLWTHPAKNAEGIPTNSIIFAVPSQGTVLSVSLEGTDQELSPMGSAGIERYLYHPGPLEAGTDYKVIFKVGEGSTVGKQSVRFTTGSSELSGAPEGPLVVGYEEWMASQALGCGEVLAAQTCFDAEAERRLLLELGLDPTGIAWTVRQVLSTGGASVPILWPGSCTAEAFTVPGESATASTCFELTALDAAGNESEPITLCPFQEEGSAPAVGGGSSSCSITKTPGPVTGVWLLLVGLFAVWRYRRYAYPSA